MDDDGSLPDPDACARSGPLPTVLKGRFASQLAYAVAKLAQIDLKNETVGFLHLKGGGWFDEIRTALTVSGNNYCELQGVNDWPENDTNIGLCTLHSAKGLEFDHVFMIGLAQSHASYGNAPTTTATRLYVVSSRWASAEPERASTLERSPARLLLRSTSLTALSSWRVHV